MSNTSVNATRAEEIRALCPRKTRGEGKQPLYGHWGRLPSHDFNREVYAPGEHPKAPEGFVGIRVDDDFWSVAMLPYEAVKYSLEDIVHALWPEIEKPRFKPDSDMPAYYKENGFPTEDDD